MRPLNKPATWQRHGYPSPDQGYSHSHLRLHGSGKYTLQGSSNGRFQCRHRVGWSSRRPQAEKRRHEGATPPSLEREVTASICGHSWRLFCSPSLRQPGWFVSQLLFPSVLDKGTSDVKRSEHNDRIITLWFVSLEGEN